MFSGEQAHQLDAKNRIRIPSQFKLPENEEIVFCKGTTPCIYVLPKSAMDKMSEQFFSLSLFDEEAQDLLGIYVRVLHNSTRRAGQIPSSSGT